MSLFVINILWIRRKYFFIFCKDFFSKCDRIRRKLRIWLHLLKKSLIENFIFYAVQFVKPAPFCCRIAPLCNNFTTPQESCHPFLIEKMHQFVTRFVPFSKTDLRQSLIAHSTSVALILTLFSSCAILLTKHLDLKFVNIQNKFPMFGFQVEKISSYTDYLTLSVNPYVLPPFSFINLIFLSHFTKNTNHISVP